MGGHLAALLARARHLCGGKREVLLHCWRGGMRSDSMRWLLETGGFTVHRLEGGYKSYRTFVRGELARPRPILVLGGYTGCGKTDILLELQRLGSQVIDLEGLARHKGSAFGALGQAEEQPGNEWFENQLYEQWRRCDPARPVWLEDESRHIGHVRNSLPSWDAARWSASCCRPRNASPISSATTADRTCGKACWRPWSACNAGWAVN